MKVLEAFSIFDPQGLLRESVAEEKLQVILNHYKSLTKSPEERAGCVAEYMSFVAFVKTMQGLRHVRHCKNLHYNI